MFDATTRFLVVLLCLYPLSTAPAYSAESTDNDGEVCVYDPLAENDERCVTPDWEKIRNHPLGTAQNPIRGFMPAGEREYLDRLSCPSGLESNYSRIGSVGIGPYGAMLDAYKVRCPEDLDRSPGTIVYMDMYHPTYVENKPIPGFGISSD